MIQLHQLEQFCAVATCEHMSKAAELLHIAQPTLSLNISRLETELGVKLFDRVGRNIVLNQYGKAFLPHIRTALSEIEAAQTAVAELDQRNAKGIFIADSILNNMSHIIRAYMFEKPKANIVHQTCILEEMRTMLLLGAIDLGVAVLAPDNLMIREFDWYPVKTTRLVALMREDHPLAAQETIRLEQLKGEPLQFAIHDFDARDAFETYCTQAGITPNLVYTSIKPYLFNEFTRKNGYISFLSEVMWDSRDEVDFEHMEQHMCTDGIVGRPVVEPECVVTYGILMKKDSRHSKAVQDFLDFALSYMKNNIGLF